MRYQIPEAKIAHELIDGEVIIIHFDEGNYYSLKGAAAQLWDLVAKGASHEQACASFGALTAGQQGELDAFFGRLVREGLLVVAETPSSDLPVFAGATLHYETPKIEKYEDMQALLAVDPIHEVAEAGWPQVKPN